jgi:hypothetical protein
VSHVFDIFKVTANPGELQQEEVKGVYWADPNTIADDMKKEADKFCQGFIESLKIYLAQK